MAQLSHSVDEIYILLNPDLDYCIVFCHLMIQHYLKKVDITKYKISDKLKDDIDQSFYIISNFSKITFDNK